MVEGGGGRDDGEEGEDGARDVCQIGGRERVDVVEGERGGEAEFGGEGFHHNGVIFENGEGLGGRHLGGVFGKCL